MLNKCLACLSGILLSSLFHIAMADDANQSVQTFDARQLQIINLHANVIINVKEQTGITVSVEGPDELANAVEIDVDGDQLKIKQEYSPAVRGITSTVINSQNNESGNYSVVSINGQTIIVKGDGVAVIAKTVEQKVIVKITVPPGTPVSFAEFKGDAEIGDIQGALVLNTSGDVNVGHVLSATVKANQSADVLINKVDRNLDLIVSQNADVLVEAGDIANLNVEVTNNGEARFNGKALNAQLSATDNGDVIVAHVTNEPSISVSRNADILIKNRK